MQTKKHQKLRNKERCRRFLSQTGWKGNRKKGGNGNAAREKSSCGLIYHMMGTEVCTLIDMTS
jgi:hypothetical protein